MAGGCGGEPLNLRHFDRAKRGLSIRQTLTTRQQGDRQHVLNGYGNQLRVDATEGIFGRDGHQIFVVTIDIPGDREVRGGDESQLPCDTVDREQFAIVGIDDTELDPSRRGIGCADRQYGRIALEETHLVSRGDLRDADFDVVRGSVGHFESADLIGHLAFIEQGRDDILAAGSDRCCVKFHAIGRTELGTVRRVDGHQRRGERVRGGRTFDDRQHECITSGSHIAADQDHHRRLDGGCGTDTHRSDGPHNARCGRRGSVECHRQHGEIIVQRVAGNHRTIHASQNGAIHHRIG